MRACPEALKTIVFMIKGLKIGRKETTQGKEFPSFTEAYTNAQKENFYEKLISRIDPFNHCVCFIKNTVCDAC